MSCGLGQGLRGRKQGQGGLGLPWQSSSAVSGLYGPPRADLGVLRADDPQHGGVRGQKE